MIKIHEIIHKIYQFDEDSLSLSLPFLTVH